MPPSPTPYRVRCDCVPDGIVYLTIKEYRVQVVDVAMDEFFCPHCGRPQTLDWDWCVEFYNHNATDEAQRHETTAHDNTSPHPSPWDPDGEGIDWGEEGWGG